MEGVTRKAGALDRIVAAVLTVAIAVYWVPAASAATAQPVLAEIRGSVLGADGLTAVRGVSVKAANMDTRQIYTSDLTGDNGSYRLTGLPAGSYDLAVSTPHGLYAADMLIDAAAGSRTIVSLALKPGAGAPAEEPPPPPPPPPDPNAPPANPDEKPDEKKPDEKKPDEKKPEDKKPEAKPEPQEQKKKKKGNSFWRTPGGAAIAIVVGAALVGAAASGATSNNDDDDDSMTAGGTSVPH